MSYIVRNPHKIRSGLRVFEMRGKSYFEGDKVLRSALDDKKKDLEALVGSGFVVLDDLTETDQTLIEASGVKGLTIEEYNELVKDDPDEGSDI